MYIASNLSLEAPPSKGHKPGENDLWQLHWVLVVMRGTEYFPEFNRAALLISVEMGNRHTVKERVS
jgi:hypothetical protein